MNALGIVRVSRTKGDDAVSPGEQRRRITEACERAGLDLVGIVEELDVSGGTPLARRTGLREAVERVEAGEIRTLVVAYFDRLVRSLTVQAEIVERVERAGGGILAVDVGEVRADTASRWLSSTLLGAVAEYHRRVTAERTAGAKADAVARGVPPYPRIPLGLRRRPDRTLEHDPETADAVREAFVLRRDGASWSKIRERLRARGVTLSYYATGKMLANRLYVGELRFGALVNTAACEPLIDRATFDAVQRRVIPRGRRPKSDYLLARLGVLRCGTCGARMVAATATGTYRTYRCPPNGNCTRHVSISAEIAERAVVDEVKRLLADVHGVAAASESIEAALAHLDQTERELEAAVLAFSGLEDVTAARERLLELKTERDRARERAEELRAFVLPELSVSVDDWDLLGPAGVERLTIEPRRE